MGQVIDLDVVEQEKWEAERKHYRLSQSKSQTKRDMLVITELGRELVELSEMQLSKLNLDDTVKLNIIKAKGLQKIALKRQTQFIGKLLRKVDNLEEIQEGHDKLTNKSKEANLMLHRLEHIRDAILDKDRSDDIMQQVIAEFPEIDIQLMRQLIRNHYREVEKNKPKKSYKLIFQMLKEQQLAQN